MSQAEVERLFAGLAGEGTTEASGLGFTLESEKAREKLQQFALAQPENYQLLALAGLYALGCRNFDLLVDADDFQISADAGLEREPFGDLWRFVSRGGEDPITIGCRLLAMAVLTSVRLDEVEWSLESQDVSGPWRFQAVVRRGLLRESLLRAGEAPVPGVRLWVRRRKLSQIALRFVARLLGRDRGGFDEQLIRRRVVLPRGASLSCNGRPLNLEPLPSPRVLAGLVTGQAPELSPSPLTYRLERDYDIAVVLCRPARGDFSADDRLPGEDNRIEWVWNGLRMDSTVLGGELDCCRATVWAPSLRPDLSFSNLVDNRDKQALERHARSAARELLDRWVREVAPRIAASEPAFGGFEDEREMVRQIGRHRLDPGRDWRRLASLNRALSEFPLLLGSGPDGQLRWVSLMEVRRELEAGRRVAAFSPSPEEVPAPVPAWHDRPLVLYTSPRERDFLKGRFPSWRLGSAEQVVEQLARLFSVSTPEVEPEASPLLLEGSGAFESAPLCWQLFRIRDGGEKPSARLRVHRPDGRSFSDTGLSLPSGLRVDVEADWTPTFRGELADRELAQRLERQLLEEVCQAKVEAFASRPPSEEEAELVALLLDQGARRWEGRLLSLPWLLLCDGDGVSRRCSPLELRAELERLEAPLYAAPWTEEVEEGSCGPWMEARIVRAPRRLWKTVERLVGRPVLAAEALTAALRHSRRAARADVRPLWRGELTARQCSSLSPALAGLGMAIFPASRAAVETRLCESLCGYPLPERSSEVGYRGVELTLDWRGGWPGERGERRWSEPGEEPDAELLRLGCPLLARTFFDQVEPRRVLEMDSELLATMLFDQLGEADGATRRVLLTAAENWTCLDEVASRKATARYFCGGDLEAVRQSWPEAVFLPGSLPEAVELLSSCRWEQVPRFEDDSPAPVEPRSARRTSSPRGDRDASTMPVAAPRREKRVADAAAPLSPSPPTSSPAEPPTLSSSQAVVSPQPLSEVAPVPARNPAFRSALLRELLPAALADAVEWPHRELFLAFLSQVEDDPEGSLAVMEDDGRVSLGRPAQRLARRADGAPMLLCALYSQFNRLRPEVDDGAERQFHAALLRAQQGDG